MYAGVLRSLLAHTHKQVKGDTDLPGDNTERFSMCVNFWRARNEILLTARCVVCVCVCGFKSIMVQKHEQYALCSL